MYKTISNDYGNWLWPELDTASCSAAFNEIEKLKEVVNLCIKKHIAVQAGGNCGVFPRVLSGLFKYTYTFEPDPINFHCLVRNVEPTNVFSFNAALGSSHVCVSLTGAPDNCGAFEVGGAGLIPVFRIDDLNLPGCDLIYLDVEGFEGFALEGAKWTLSQYEPIVAIEEKTLGDKHGWTEARILSFMGELGFRKITKMQNDLIFETERHEHERHIRP